jgi:predicted O-methyltransferase YrrM
LAATAPSGSPALPSGGTLLTLEFQPKHAEVAAANIERAGLSSVVELRVGRALDSLAQLHAEGAQPFDFIFIDADKPNNPSYLEWALRFSRTGTAIVCDNVIREGDILDPRSTDTSVQGTRRLFELLAGNSRIDATALQTVGSKGHDGFVLGIVR